MTERQQYYEGSPEYYEALAEALSELNRDEYEEGQFEDDDDDHEDQRDEQDEEELETGPRLYPKDPAAREAIMEADSAYWLSRSKGEEKVTTRDLPDDPAEASDSELVAWARGQTNPERKITLGQANSLGGPTNPRVAELARRGLVEGWEPPKDGLPQFEDGKARLTEAVQIHEAKLAAEKKAQEELTRRQRDPRGAARERAIAEIQKLPPDVREQVLEDATNREWEKRWGRL